MSVPPNRVQEPAQVAVLDRLGLLNRLKSYSRAYNRGEIRRSTRVIATYILGAGDHVAVFNITTGEVEASHGPVGYNSLAFDAEGERYASVRPAIYAFNADHTPLVEGKAVPNPNILNGCGWSVDGSLFAVAQNGANGVTFALYDTTNFDLVSVPTVQPSSRGYDIQFSPDGNAAIVGARYSPYLIIYNTSDWSVLATVDGLPGRPVGQITTDSAYYIGGLGSTIYVIDLSDGSFTSHTLDGLFTSVRPQVAVSPDGSVVYVPSGPTNKGEFAAYSTSDWSFIGSTIVASGKTVNNIDVNRENTLVATSRHDGRNVPMFNTADLTPNTDVAYNYPQDGYIGGETKFN
jgi:WD40 repeat protein